MLRRAFGVLLLVGGLAASGCGPSLHPVVGTLTADGAPVAGANVIFVSADGSKTYSAPTNAEGRFSLATGDKEGIAPGDYKVLIVKYPVEAGIENLKPSDPEYLKHMEKAKKDSEKATKASAAPSSGPPGMRAPSSVMPNAKTAPPQKSELPSIYASIATTPVNVTVPLKTTPVAIEIKKDAPPKK